jgi:hypothetical protein
MECFIVLACNLGWIYAVEDKSPPQVQGTFLKHLILGSERGTDFMSACLKTVL